MSNNLFDILDDCISRLEAGEDIESCLARYPMQASELRPLLEAAMDASSLVVNEEIPIGVAWRGKARMLDIVDEMREQRTRKPLPLFNWQRPLRRAMTVLTVFALAFAITGTGLVYASNGTLPGDNLYSIKRTWEDIRLQLAFNPQVRESLEDTFDHERLEEVTVLMDSGRAAKVEFSGIVTGIFHDQFVVAGLQVLINGDTRVAGIVLLDSWVKVEGHTQPNGSVIASEVKVISSTGIEDNPLDNSNNNSQSGEDNSGKSGKSETPEIESNKTPEPEKTEKTESEKSGESDSKDQSFELEGVVTDINGSQVTVDGRTIIISSETEITNQPGVGSSVSIRGYQRADGTFVAVRIEKKGDGGSDNNDSGGDGNDGGSNENKPTRTQKPGEGDHSGDGSSDHTPEPTENHSGGED
jgi:hypothetical protein